MEHCINCVAVQLHDAQLTSYDNRMISIPNPCTAFPPTSHATSPIGSSSIIDMRLYFWPIGGITETATCNSAGLLEKHCSETVVRARPTEAVHNRTPLTIFGCDSKLR